MALVRLSASLAVPEPDRWREALREAERLADRVEVEEVLLQAHLFVGFPVVLNAFITWIEEAPRGAAPIAAEARDRRVAGEALCRTVYGKAYERLRENVRGLHPDLDRWMVEEGYGRTLSRPGLSIEIRELCIVALLAAGRQDRQLRAHLFGALNVGAPPDEVEAALLVGIDVATGAAAGRDAADVLMKLWEDVRRNAS